MENNIESVKTGQNIKTEDILIDANTNINAPILKESDILPNQTLYVNNLNEKIKAEGIIQYINIFLL
jgi:hypothetical protein